MYKEVMAGQRKQRKHQKLKLHYSQKEAAGQSFNGSSCSHYLMLGKDGKLLKCKGLLTKLPK